MKLHTKLHTVTTAQRNVRVAALIRARLLELREAGLRPPYLAWLEGDLDALAGTDKHYAASVARTWLVANPWLFVNE